MEEELELEMKYFVIKLENHFNLTLLLQKLQEFDCSPDWGTMGITGYQLAKIILETENK